ncbi:hypothetical protein [Colwellia psychrerythraea]|uniref:hypothetical protein n=1 Tax=Colwellia psychrerythraea TaxID=28229 RepID=UPI00051A6431|nr:hypothetical protein [Colwellia psychrerythraea]
MSEPTWSWSAVSAIASAIAAIVALFTVLLTLKDRSDRYKKENSRSSTRIYAALIQLDRAFDNTIQLITGGHLSTLKHEVFFLLKVVAELGVDEDISILPSEIEKLLVFLDGLDNDDDWDVKEATKILVNFQKGFRKSKHSLGKKAGVTHS